MKLGKEVGLVPSHIVSDGDPALSKRDTAPIFGPCPLWPNGWMDQYATWHRGRPRARRHCVRRETSSRQKGGTAAFHLSAHVLWPTAGWIKMAHGTEVGLGLGHIVLHGDPAPHRKGHSTPSFQPVSIVAKRSPISATAEHLCFIISMELGIYKYVGGGV